METLSLIDYWRNADNGTNVLVVSDGHVNQSLSFPGSYSDLAEAISGDVVTVSISSSGGKSEFRLDVAPARDLYALRAKAWAKLEERGIRDFWSVPLTREIRFGNEAGNVECMQVDALAPDATDGDLALQKLAAAERLKAIEASLKEAQQHVLDLGRARSSAGVAVERANGAAKKATKRV